MTPVPTVVILQLLLLRLLGLLATFIDDLDVVVEDGGNDRDHVGLDHPRPDAFGASDAYVDDALEGQVPLPHVHHVLAPALLEDADKPLDASIDSEDVANAGRGCCQISKMIERVDQRQCRGAIEGTSVIQGSGDAHGRLVDVGDAEVDFPHLGPIRLGAPRGHGHGKGGRLLPMRRDVIKSIGTRSEWPSGGQN